MANKISPLDKRINTYIERLFSDVSPSQQLFDLKEELFINLKEKISDYKERGMDEEQAFKEAIISMGDLSGLIEDMRKIGQDSAKQTVYSKMQARISTLGIVAGALITLFGIFTVLITYFMNLPNESVVGTGIFIVAGGVLMTYSILTRETRKKYAMNKTRAFLYSLSIGLILFAIFTAIITFVTTNEMFMAISSLMVFFMAGVGLFLYLILTGRNRYKDAI
ncbi:permease prefix domain 1-containing protein [Calidifontibacillus erzurumensis]|nr:permease prefix domain 1-containing protein [Calidifontibacillus erzurumensis]